MEIKKSLSIFAVLAFLLSAIAFFAFSVDRSDRVARNGDGKPDDGNASAPQVLLDRIHKKLEAVSTPDQFEALGREILGEVPREHLSELLRLLLERWIEKDQVTALDFVYGLQADDIRQTVLPYTFAKAGYLDFRAIMAWISRQPASAKGGLTGLLYESVGEQNPGYALGFIDLLDEGEVKDRLMRTLLERWAQRDAAAALSWMNMQERPELEDLKATFLSALMNREPQEAASLIRDMRPGYQKNALARKYADLVAKADIQGAMGWAHSLDDPDAYGIALTAVYETWFQKEPDKELIMEQVLAESDGDLRDRLINEIALDMANSDPAELASIIDRLPETSQSDVAEKAVRFWKDRDRQQTLDWINSLSAGPVRDRVLKVMVEDFLMRGDREGAASLATSMGDRSARYDSVKTAAEHWYRTNPAEARRMLEDISFLSESEKEAISQHLGNPRQ